MWQKKHIGKHMGCVFMYNNKHENVESLRLTFIYVNTPQDKFIGIPHLQPGQSVKV